MTNAPGGGEPGEDAPLFRALRLLHAVADAERPLSIADLVTILAIPKPTVHRMCQRLEAEGYLEREPGARQFTVGPRLVALSLGTLRASRGGARRAVLEELVQRLDETCNLTVLSGQEVLYLDRVESRWPLRVHLEPGSRVPLYCTASGKLFLAFVPPAQRKRLLDAFTLAPLTAATITDRLALEAELGVIAERGYSIDNEEFLQGLVAVAVPVRDARGAMVAAIACHGPTARLSIEKLLSYLPLLQEAAQRIARLLVGGPSSGKTPA